MAEQKIKLEEEKAREPESTRRPPSLRLLPRSI